VLCEKPLEVNAERTEQLVSVCDRQDVTLMTAYRMQIHPTVRRLRDLVDEGFVGDPVQIHSGFSLTRTDPDQWRLDPDLAGGGALPDLGVYPLNTSRFFLDSDPTAVQATTVSVHDRFEGVDEHVSFELTFPGNVIASCTASYNAHRDNRFQLVGTEGQILIEPAYDVATERTVTIEHGDQQLAITGTGADEVREELDYFADRILSDVDPEPDRRDGLTDVEVMDAVYASSDAGRSISL
jgi:xylose dehydrogenase (NAD/NADP)